jgi:hypothetical protein
MFNFTNKKYKYILLDINWLVIGDIKVGNPISINDLIYTDKYYIVHAVIHSINTDNITYLVVDNFDTTKKPQ